MRFQGGRKHIGEIDFIRFVCAVLMVYYHITPRLSVKFPDNALYYSALTQRNGMTGSIGVLCFFILSGLFFQLNREWEGTSPGRFLLRKAARLWPVMAFSILVNCRSTTDILNLFFINSGLGVITKTSSNPASWYVCVLFWIFGLYFLWFRGAGKRRTEEEPDLRGGVSCCFF